MGDEREGKRIKLTAEDEEWERFQAEIAQVESGVASSDAHIIEAEPQINTDDTEDSAQHEQKEEEQNEDNIAEEQRIYEELETQKDLQSRVGELKSRVRQWKEEKPTSSTDENKQQDIEEDQDDESDYDEDEDVFNIKK
jgi:hypothetical protein